MSGQFPARFLREGYVPPVKRLGVVATVLAVLALALVVYARVGWSRMENACAADPPGGPAWRSVEYSWSWSPVGFQCTYADGRQRSSLWF